MLVNVFVSQNDFHFLLGLQLLDSPEHFDSFLSVFNIVFPIGQLSSRATHSSPCPASIELLSQPLLASSICPCHPPEMILLSPGA